MLTSGNFYLQAYDPQYNRYVESQNFFSFSKFFNNDNPNFNPIDLYQSLSVGLITSGQIYSDLGVKVVSGSYSSLKQSYPAITGYVPEPANLNQLTITPLSGPAFTYSINVPLDTSSFLAKINNITYIKVYQVNQATLQITGYYVAVDANPL